MRVKKNGINMKEKRILKRSFNLKSKDFCVAVYEWNEYFEMITNTLRLTHKDDLQSINSTFSDDSKKQEEEEHSNEILRKIIDKHFLVALSRC